MPILFTIALRNLKEHKSKTLIVGILIALGILILTLGNSILLTASRGIEKTFIDAYTGHILVRSKAERPVSISGTFGPSTGSGQTISSYSDVYDYVSSLPQVTASNPQVPAFAIIDYNEGENERGAFLSIFGIEPGSYLEMFPNSIRIVEGRFLENEENGIVINKTVADEIREELEIDIAVGDELKIQAIGRGNTGVRIRRVTLRGVYEYTSDGSTDVYTFMDVSTVRSLRGLVVGTSDVINIDEADSSLLDVGDDLFSDESFFSDDDLFGDDSVPLSTEEGEQDIFNILGDNSSRAIASTPDAGAWAYILLRLESDRQLNSTIAEINAHFEEEGMAVEAVDWFAASGGTAQFNRAIQIFFYIVIVILAVVSVIIIMNTLVISVIARTKEIGTMRSLGAYKTMVREMFIAETMSISFVFGTIGLLLGLLVILILNLIGLQSSNVLISSIIGGTTLKPAVDIGTIFLGYLVMLGIGLISSWYPVRVALKIQPLEAMQSH